MKQMKKIIFKLRIINCILILVAVSNIVVILGCAIIFEHPSLSVKKQVMMVTGENIKSYILPDFRDEFDKDYTNHIERVLDDIKASRDTLGYISLINFFCFGALMIVFIMQFLLAKDIARIKKALCFQESEECVSKEKHNAKKTFIP